MTARQMSYLLTLQNIHKGASMKFQFERTALLKEISVAQEVITNKSPIAILSCVLLQADGDTLTIRATDTSVHFKARIKVDITESGEATVFCDKFMGILSALPQGLCEFATDDLGVVIKSTQKRVKFNVRQVAQDEFPSEPQSGGDSFSIPSKNFKDLVKQTIFAVSDDPNRFFMTGVFFTKEDDGMLTLVSTNARRLAIAKTDIGNIQFPPSIVPIKILRLATKVLGDEGDIDISFNGNLIFIKAGAYEFAGRLIDGQFPNYSKVIPTEQKFSLKVNKDDLDAAIHRIEIMTEKKGGRVIFKMSPGLLRISSKQSDLGDAAEELECNYDGDEMSLAFNFRYISEPLHSAVGDTIILDFTENLKAVTIRSEGADYYKHVIMPMSLNDGD